MSVRYWCEKWAIVDHQAWIVHMIDKYRDHHTELHQTKMNFHKLFDLRTPFLMDGQASKMAMKLDCGEANISERAAIRERKRKRKKEARKECDERDGELGHIQEIFSALRLTPEFKAHFTYTPTSEDFRLNNSHIRDLGQSFTEATRAALPPLDEHSGTQSKLQYKTVNGEKYLLPPGVRYVCGEVADILKYTAGTTYDLVVLDPPWQNKYIKRRKKGHGNHHGYDMMSVEDILSLPIGRVMKAGGMVAVWCTNNMSLIQDFMDGLNQWNVQLVATWYWLKLTLGGEPVTPLDDPSLGKQPYERLFLAQRCTLDGCYTNIPDGLVFCSVPSGLHSHKPPLNELLREYVSSEAECLEMFARSLVPGWTCLGREVLRLQHSVIFQDSHTTTTTNTTTCTTTSCSKTTSCSNTIISNITTLCSNTS